MTDTEHARIELRADTAANWTAANPVLAAGEPAWETDTKKLKIGDGVTAWNALVYYGLTDPEFIRDTIAAALQPGSNVTITPDDLADIITIAAASGGSGVNSRVKLADTILTAAAASFDFASLSQSYDDLEIVFEGRHATSSAPNGVTLSLNNDTTDANYARTFHYWNSGGDGTATGASRGVLETSGSGTNKCFGRILIPSYKRTDFYKAFTAQGTEHGDTAYTVGGEWRNTAAINRVTLRNGDGGNFAVGSRCRVYGLLDV